MSLMIKPHPFLLLTIFILFSSTLYSISHGASSTDLHFQSNHIPGGTVDENKNSVVGWGARRSVMENSSMILAAQRTTRKDPLNDFHYYTGGWNITNKHYFSSVGFTGIPFFLIAAIWFVGFGLCLLLICCCFCCCRREPYGYSRAAYALSLLLLALFTVAAVIGCVVLYTGQGKFHSSTSYTLEYVVLQANNTVENLGNVSDYLAAAKRIGIYQISLPTNVQNNIDNVDNEISAAATTLQSQTKKNKNNIENVLDTVRLALIIIAAVMLLLALMGFRKYTDPVEKWLSFMLMLMMFPYRVVFIIGAVFSILGLQFLVYLLVIIGWILVAATFILSGVFLVVHNMVGDTCVAMDQWVQNPTAHTALDDILPCVDNATAQATWTQSKEVTYQLVVVMNTAITNVSNRNFPRSAPNPPYFNQSGPLVPVLCNPFNADLSNRTCAAGELGFENATQVWQNYVCQVSSNNTCTTVGRLTPTMYSQMINAANVSYGLYHYGPFLVGLLDCSFVRETFTGITQEHCPDLRQYSNWVYIGLAMVSAAVMLSLIFWVIYARERRHRKYTKLVNASHENGSYDR